MLKDSTPKIKAYTRDLFKKNRKPYALPVKFVPCQTLKDEQVREFNQEIKQKMVEKGLKVVGRFW